MFTDYIVDTLIDIYHLVIPPNINRGGGRYIIGQTDLLKTLDQFSSGIYKGVNSIQENVVMPIALVILSLFLLLELYNIVVRFDSSHQLMGIELPLKVMFKAVIYKMVLEKSGEIMRAIYNLSLELLTRMKGTLGVLPNEIEISKELLEESIGKLSWDQALMSAVFVFLVWLIIWGINIAIQVLIVGRFIEIYVFIAVSPIPIATLPNNELGIAKNFFKSFAAVCVHGIFLYLIIAIIPYLINEIVPMTIDGANFKAEVLKMLFCSAVMGVAAIGSSRWAKALCNAM